MPDNFGERLKKLRKKAGLTQEELAEKAGVSNITISQWENGVYAPTMTRIKALAQALNVSEADLLNDPPPDSGEWVITLKTTQKIEMEEINLSGNVSPVTSIHATPQGCTLTIQANWEKWETKKELEQLFKRIMRETYPAVRGAGVAFGRIKKD